MLFRYLIRRLLLSIGVLLAVLLLTYALGSMSDADPVLRYLYATSQDPSSTTKAEADLRAYRQGAAALGVDRPAFFFQVIPFHYPDTIYRLAPRARRTQAEALLQLGWSWPQIENLQQVIWSGQPDLAHDQRAARLAQTKSQLLSAGVDSAQVLQASEQHDSELLRPKFNWIGFDNGLSHHIRQASTGGFGYSLERGQPVRDMVLPSLKITLALSSLALLIAAAVGLPWGIMMARSNHGTHRLLAYALLSAPGFWLATIFVSNFAGRGRPFPGPGWVAANASPFHWLHAATLPILVLAIPTAAYLALVLAESIQREDRLPIRDFARLLGANERRVWWQDMLPLGLVPSVVTAIGFLVPSVVSGSVVVEYLFNIPGLGRLSYESILARDWPVVLAVVWLGAIATVIGYTLADLVNAWLDPRWRKLVIHAG